MGQDVEGMGCGERIICLCLTVCFGVAVFSTVNFAFINTMIIYHHWESKFSLLALQTWNLSDVEIIRIISFAFSHQDLGII